MSHFANAAMSNVNQSVLIREAASGQKFKSESTRTRGIDLASPAGRIRTSRSAPPTAGGGEPTICST